MTDIIYQPITLHLDDNDEVIQVELQEAVQPITIEFADDVAANAAIREAIAVDRQAIEDSLAASQPVLEEALLKADDIAASLGVIDTNTALVQSLADDTTAKHSEIKTWHDAHDTDKVYFAGVRDDMVASETNYQAIADSLNQGSVDFTIIQADVTTRHTDIVTRHDDTVIKHGEVLSARDDVEADRAEVALNAADVQTRQSDIITRQDDVIARQTAVDLAATTAITDIEAEGDAQVLRVTGEGNAQFSRVQTEGQTQVDAAVSQVTLATTQAGIATTKAADAADSVTTAATHESNAANSATAAAASEATVAGRASAAALSETNAAGSATAASTSEANALASETSAASDAAQVASDKSAVTALRDEVEADRVEVASNTALVSGYKNEAKTYRDEAVNAAASLTGAMTEAGNFDASSNTLPPKPVVSTFWKITVAGTLDGVDYGVGDSLVYSLNADTFFKIDNTESVTSVNGQQGVVTLSAADVSALPDTTTLGTLGGYTTTEVDNALASKAEVLHTHPYRADTWVPGWTDVTGKPTDFPPASHSHSIAEVTGLQASLDGKAASGHVHGWADITGKPLTFAPDAHDHDDRYYTETEVDGLLGGKAEAAHTHPYRPDTWVPSISDITGLQGALDAKDSYPEQTGNSGKLLSTDGTDTLWIDPPVSLPDQTGNAGKLLSTDGSTASWAEAPDTLPDQSGHDGKVLKTDGSAASWQDESGGGGDVTEAPSDGRLYIRHNGNWVAVEDTILESSPAGVKALWDGSTPPAGWLESDGAELFENQHPELFAAYRGSTGVADQVILAEVTPQYTDGTNWANGLCLNAYAYIKQNSIHFVGAKDGFNDTGIYLNHYLTVAGVEVKLTTHVEGNIYEYTVISGSESVFRQAFIDGQQTFDFYLKDQTINDPDRAFLPNHQTSDLVTGNDAAMVIIKALSGPNLISQIAVPQRSVYNATAGQQTFNHLYEAGRPLSVFMDGVKLIKDLDFTATTGTNIQLLSPLVADADLEIESFGKLVLSDMIGDSVHDGQSHVRRDGMWVPEKIVDYALLDFGTVTNNNRYVQTNPFGNDTKVFTCCEVYANGNWYETPVTRPDSSGSMGIFSGSVDGEGVVLRTGQYSLLDYSQYSANLYPGDIRLFSAPCRVHVWRLGV